MSDIQCLQNKYYQPLLKKWWTYRSEFIGTKEKVDRAISNHIAIYEKHFLGLDWQGSAQHLRQIAAYIHVQMFKSLGPTEIRSDAWSRVLCDRYADIVGIGECLAFLAIGSTDYKYNISDQVVLQQASGVFFDENNFDAMMEFVQALSIDVQCTHFLQSVPGMYIQLLGKHLPDEVFVQLYTRLVLYGFLCCHIAAGKLRY